MKNKRIIDAWNKIEPDSVAGERMLKAILARNRSMGHSEQERVPTMKKTFNWKRFAPVAACLVMVIAITAVFGNNAGWFGNRIYTANIASGEIISFYKTNAPSAGSLDFGIEVTTRELTTEENSSLFGNLGVTAQGAFSTIDKTLLRVEGKTGNVKIILAAQGVPVTDTVIEVDRDKSEIGGVQVSAGYFITDANSSGTRNIIYLATFDIDGISVYIECGGNEKSSDDLKAEIANVIDTLIQNGAPDFSAVTE